MTTDEQAIRDLISTWLAASAAGDTERVLSLMADDAVFLMPGQEPMRGKVEAKAAARKVAAIQTRLRHFSPSGRCDNSRQPSSAQMIAA